jgi:3-deoxy-manno-octulosonate cytidylyltransferase (CMP-KDO synthetase)
MGKPLIQQVYERAQMSPGITRVLVATDDERIAAAVTGFQGTAILTTKPYRTGTDRVAAVARDLPGQVFVDLQGDEIVLHPELISDLVAPFLASDVGMGTLKRRLIADGDLQNPGVVKVVTDSTGNALYFSRAPVPCVRDDPPGRPRPGLHYVHLGIYIYTREVLMQLANLPSGPLEEAEHLEQLRALEHGVPIRVWETTHHSLRVDTPEDLRKAEAALLGLVNGAQVGAKAEAGRKH